ncbi:hypothetical protein RIF29_27513 [Crotalaria pallida]|uniref:Uncharacterized protein n=1 Tax=Crotalaria pallida TaxID=3830 RepID=A0AAN9EQ47_CROPI
MIGSAVGGTTSAFYGFNHVMPVVQRRIKGPMWLHFLHWCGAIPAVAQLISSSYHAAFSPPPLPPPSKDDEIQKSRTSSTI